MRKFLTTSILVVLIIVSGALMKVWAGFVYFALSFSLLLALYWMVELIYKYTMTYYKDFEDEFNTYIARLINTTNLTSEQLEKSRPFYIKKFKKSRWKQKLHDLIYIILAVGVIIALIVAFLLI